MDTGVWKEIEIDNAKKTDLRSAVKSPLDPHVSDFRNVCPRTLGKDPGNPNDPLTLTADKLTDRLLQKATLSGLLDPHETETRMFRLLRVVDQTDPAVGISLALDRTLQRDASGRAHRDHWCVSLGLSAKCIATKSAKEIYSIVKSRLLDIKKSDPKHNFALLWYASQATPQQELTNVIVDQVFAEMLKDSAVTFDPHPKDAPAEPAYAHFKEHLENAYGSSVAPKVRFVKFSISG